MGDGWGDNRQLPTEIRERLREAQDLRREWGATGGGVNQLDDIIEQLKAVEKRYPGIDRVVCATPLGTPLDVQLEDLDRFAKEVIPAFRDKKVAAAAE